MNISGNLRSIMEVRKISIDQLSTMSGISSETIKSLLYNKSNDPKVSTIKALVNALEISYETLIDDSNLMDTSFMSLYNRCTPSVKATLQMIATNNIVRNNTRVVSNTYKIKCVIPTTWSDDGIINDTCETVEIETNLDNAFIGYKITTNNFFDVEILKGDIILLERREPAENELAVFSNGYKSYLRKLQKHNNGYILKAINKNSKDIVVLHKEKYFKWNCVGTYIAKIEKAD